jgi:hypothetical protein
MKNQVVYLVWHTERGCLIGVYKTQKRAEELVEDLKKVAVKLHADTKFTIQTCPVEE